MYVHAFRLLVFAFGYDMELDREKEFRTFLAEKFPSVKRGTIGVFHRDFGDKIKAATKRPIVRRGQEHALLCKEKKDFRF